MKKALFPVIALALIAVGTSLVSAAPAPGRKRPGPSAVQAARLKKYPPPNYLSHYLPDDRYKIAGGVWKYVSTDLDTYYHVPSSANMLRQPANRVIGFANARDAEEAGYVADPTDGTATRAAPQTSIGGNNSQELAYLKQVTSVIAKWSASDRELNVKVANAVTRNNQQTAQGILLAMRPLANEYVSSNRKLVAEVRRITPPSRLRNYHLLITSGLQKGVDAALVVRNVIMTGDTSQLSKMAAIMRQGSIYLLRANAELKRLRIS